MLERNLFWDDVKQLIIAIAGGIFGAIFGLVGAEIMSWSVALFLIGVYGLFCLFVLILINVFFLRSH